MKATFQQLNIPARASFVIKEYYQPQFTAAFHFHSGYELIYIVTSYGKFYGGDKVMNFEAGDIYLFGPGFGHCFYNDRSFVLTGEIAHAIVIQFTEEFMGGEFFQRPELGKIKKMLNKTAAGLKIEQPPPIVKDIFFRFGKSPMSNLIVLFQLLDKLSEVPRQQMSSCNNHPPHFYDREDPGRMESVVKYVIENFKEGVSSSAAASLACLNEAAFCRYFKRRTKRTFSQFVNEVRITHATKLLRERKESIASICFQCGYNNLSYFNRQFALHIGKSPLKYRKEFTGE
jgi:AraC-like DNA-binding protein